MANVYYTIFTSDAIDNRHLLFGIQVTVRLLLLFKISSWTAALLPKPETDSRYDTFTPPIHPLTT